MEDLLGAHHGGRCAPGAGELLAGIVRELMAACRARLAAEDGAREVSSAETSPAAPRESTAPTVPLHEHPPTRPGRA